MIGTVFHPAHLFGYTTKVNPELLVCPLECRLPPRSAQTIGWRDSQANASNDRCEIEQGALQVRRNEVTTAVEFSHR